LIKKGRNKGDPPKHQFYPTEGAERRFQTGKKRTARVGHSIEKFSERDRVRGKEEPTKIKKSSNTGKREDGDQKYESKKGPKKKRGVNLSYMGEHCQQSLGGRPKGGTFDQKSVNRPNQGGKILKWVKHVSPKIWTEKKTMVLGNAPGNNFYV